MICAPLRVRQRRMGFTREFALHHFARPASESSTRLPSCSDNYLPKALRTTAQQLSILRAVRLLQHHGYVGDRVDEGTRVGRMARMGSLWSGTAA